jgi:hypothetical protein
VPSEDGGNRSSLMIVTTYKTTWCHNPGHNTLFTAVKILFHIHNMCLKISGKVKAKQSKTFIDLLLKLEE